MPMRSSPTERERPDGRYPDAERQLAGGRVCPGQSRNTGRQVTLTSGNISRAYDLNTTQIYNYDLGNFDSYSQNDRYKSQSQNYNVELKYDNGRPLQGSGARHLRQRLTATRPKLPAFSPSNGAQWQPGGIGHYPSGDIAFNPGGYQVNTVAGAASLPASVDFTGAQPVFTLPTQLTTLLGNIDNYALKTTSSEGNYRRKGDLKLVRGDVTYEANDNVSVAAGVRYSERIGRRLRIRSRGAALCGQASQTGGCLVKWKAFDVPRRRRVVLCRHRHVQHAGLSVPTRPVLTRKAKRRDLQWPVKQYDLPAPPYLRSTSSIQRPWITPSRSRTASTRGTSKSRIRAHPSTSASSRPRAMRSSTSRAKSSASRERQRRVKIINTRLDITQYVTGSPRPYGCRERVERNVETKRSFHRLSACLQPGLRLPPAT